MKAHEPEKPYDRIRFCQKRLQELMGALLCGTTPAAAMSAIASEVINTAETHPDELGFIERVLLDPAEEMCQCIRRDIERMRNERTEH